MSRLTRTNQEINATLDKLTERKDAITQTDLITIETTKGYIYYLDNKKLIQLIPTEGMMADEDVVTICEGPRGEKNYKEKIVGKISELKVSCIGVTCGDIDRALKRAQYGEDYESD